MSTVLEFKNVQMHYPYEPFPLIGDLSFELKHGQTLGIVVAKQWGKSTIAKLIAGLKAQTDGQILLHGLPLSQTPPQKRNIVVIYDDFALMRRKFWVNAAYPLKVRKISKQQRKQSAEQALTHFGLEKFSNVRVSKKTSCEQKLTLALARASLRDFNIIVFDDVFKNVSAELAHEKIQKLLIDRHVAQLFLSSDVTKLPFCDRLIVVANGKNCFEGAYKQAQNFIAESNCFDALYE